MQTLKFGLLCAAHLCEREVEINKQPQGAEEPAKSSGEEGSDACVAERRSLLTYLLTEGSEFYFFYGNEDMPLPTCTEHT